MENKIFVYQGSNSVKSVRAPNFIVVIVTVGCYDYICQVLLLINRAGGEVNHNWAISRVFHGMVNEVTLLFGRQFYHVLILSVRW